MTTNKQTNSFKFYSNFLDAINILPENERATACYEFCKYGITGELPQDKSLAMFCVGVSVSVQKYQGSGGNHNPTGKNQWSKEVKSGQNGQTGQNEQTETETETITKTKTGTKSIRPSLQEVIYYCNERNNGVDANKWYDYYTANGWKVGRNPMKDWKATVRTWERKQEKPAHPTNEGSEKMVLIDTTSFYLDDTMDEYKDLFEGVLNKDELALNVWKWIVKNFEGRSLKLSFIRSMIEKFKNEGSENERSIEK